MADAKEKGATSDDDMDTVHDEPAIAEKPETEVVADEDKKGSTPFQLLSGRRSTCGDITLQSPKVDADMPAADSGDEPASDTTATRDDDEAFRRAQAMALVMARHPNLSPEEAMLLCNPDERQRRLVQERRKGKKPTLWEEALAGKNLSAWLGGSGREGVLGALTKSFQPEALSSKSGAASDALTSLIPDLSPDDDSFTKKDTPLQDASRVHSEKAKSKVSDYEKSSSLTQFAHKSPNTNQKAALSPTRLPFGAAKNDALKSASTTPIASTFKANGSGGGMPSLPLMSSIGNITPTLLPATNAVSSVDKSTDQKSRPALTTTASANAATLSSYAPTPTPFLTTPAVKTATRVPTLNNALQPPLKSQSSRNATFNRTTSPISDSISEQSYTRGDEEEKPTISGIIWKRRSGLGKLSARNAWEKRRTTLSGSKIMYYKTLDEEAAEESERQDSRRSVSSTGSFGALDSKPKMWWEQAALNFQTAKENLTQTLSAAGLDVPTDPNAPRGVLDLAKEPHPSVAATNGHSGAPSPFAVSIQVKGETKWKFCFENQKQQMQWLTALTDVIVSMSVDEYNSGLVKLENLGLLGDPAKGMLVGGMGESPLQQYNSLVASSVFHAPPGGKDRLWRLDHYTVSSSNLMDGCDGGLNNAEAEKKAEEEVVDINNEETSKNEKEGRLGDEGEDEDFEEGVEDEKLVEVAERENVNANEVEAVVAKDEKVTEAPDVACRNVLDSSSSTDLTGSLSYFFLPIFSAKVEPGWSLEGDGLYGVFLIMNVAMFCCRASVSARFFWFVVVLVNVAVWLLVVKEQPSSDTETKEPIRKMDLSGVGIKTSFGSSVLASPDELKAFTEADSFLVALSADPIKPVAGTSSLRIKHHSDSSMKDGERFIAWTTIHRNEFKVRSHGYLVTKKKVTSALELYRVARVDVFESNQRIPDIAPKVILPEVSFDDNGIEKNWHSPDIFVVSLAVPTEVPSLRRATEDGPGFTVVIYYVMKEETRKVLRRITADGYDPANDTTELDSDTQNRAGNSIRLFEEWCRRAPTDPSFMGRFKLIPNVQNLKEIGMPSYMAKYAGKPVLIKRAGVTGFIYQHPDINVMEFDISIHPFPYLAKQATAYLKDNIFKKLLVSFGFVIEGRSDEELPEVLIGEAVQLCYPDPTFCIHADDFFSGTSRQSFHLKDGSTQ